MPTVTSKQILDAAARDIGYHEGPGHHNKYGEWFGMDGVPWCMEAVQYWYHEAGADLPHKTASCGDLLRWYREHQPECVTDDPVPGCIVIMDFPGGAPTDHTGIYVKLADRKLTTIDGNTSGVNDTSGGWVQQRTRTVDYARPVYIVPHELREYTMIRYDTMAEIKAALPWAVPTVEKLIRLGALTGKSGWYDGDGYPTGLDLSEDMIRVFVILIALVRSVNKKGAITMWEIPDNLLAENGGDIIREEREDGSVSYRPMHVKHGVGNYTGSGMPDMNRKPELAGQTVSDGEWERTYDGNGYCVQLLHLTAKK